MKNRAKSVSVALTIVYFLLEAPMNNYVVLLLTLAVFVSGCTEGPVLIVHQTGSTAAQRSAAIDHCEIASFRNIPQTMATHIDPGYSSPGSMQCNTIGNSTYCNRVGGINIPATAITYDVNQGLRNRYVSRCLNNRGYSIIERPICFNDKDKQIAKERIRNDRQPPANQIPCVVWAN